MAIKQKFIGRTLLAIVGAHKAMSRRELISSSRVDGPNFDKALFWLLENDLVHRVGADAYEAHEGALETWGRMRERARGKTKPAKCKNEPTLGMFLGRGVPLSGQMKKLVKRLRSDGTAEGLKEEDLKLVRRFVREGVVGYHATRIPGSEPSKLIMKFFALLKQALKDRGELDRLQNLLKQELANIDGSKFENRPSAKQRNEPHLQQVIFDKIQQHPEEFYVKPLKSIKERVEVLQSGIDELDSSVRKYAEFNLQFFSMLASEERDFEPIKLPDDAGYFRWPDTDVIHTSRNAAALSLDAEDAGVLSMLGYNVQVNGPTDPQRRRILDDLFNGNSQMPAALPTQYLAQWGEVKSVVRLRKIAYSIASFTRQQKRKQNASRQAIGKWEADLAYLRRRYYEPFANHFYWPTT